MNPNEFWSVVQAGSQNINQVQKQNQEQIASLITSAQAEKKKSKAMSRKKLWNDKYKVVSVGNLNAVEGTVFRKRYNIKFNYSDETGKIHQASVKFGDKAKTYFVDSKNIDDKMKAMSRETKNIFSAKYWEFWLLSMCPTIQAGHAYYRQIHDLL